MAALICDLSQYDSYGRKTGEENSVSCTCQDVSYGEKGDSASSQFIQEA